MFSCLQSKYHVLSDNLLHYTRLQLLPSPSLFPSTQNRWLRILTGKLWEPLQGNWFGQRRPFLEFTSFNWVNMPQWYPPIMSTKWWLMSENNHLIDNEGRWSVRQIDSLSDFSISYLGRHSYHPFHAIELAEVLILLDWKLIATKLSK